MCVGAFSSVFFTKCMENVITNSLIRFIIALIIGALVAAVFGILIGIPVLRLKGDYLAIVTLAFGEIIKNLVNVLFIGKDSHGLHFSMKDTTFSGIWNQMDRLSSMDHRVLQVFRRIPLL